MWGGPNNYGQGIYFYIKEDLFHQHKAMDNQL